MSTACKTDYLLLACVPFQALRVTSTVAIFHASSRWKGQRIWTLFECTVLSYIPHDIMKYKAHEWIYGTWTGKFMQVYTKQIQSKKNNSLLTMRYLRPNYILKLWIWQWSSTIITTYKYIKGGPMHWYWNNHALKRFYVSCHMDLTANVNIISCNFPV